MSLRPCSSTCVLLFGAVQFGYAISGALVLEPYFARLLPVEQSFVALLDLEHLMDRPRPSR